MEHTHMVSVLFTRQRDRSSRALYWITGRDYTHASLRLDEMGDEFYSFNFKGFCVERPERFDEKRTSTSMLYRVQVSDAAYQNMYKAMTEMLQSKKSYHYDKFGLVLCLLRIPHKFSHSYFCSQFVTEMLKKANAVSLSRGASICLPNALEKELRMAPNTIQAQLNPHRLGRDALCVSMAA